MRRDDLREADDGEVERLGSVAGIGDLNLLAKYRLTDGESSSFALIGGIKLPTGSTHKTSSDGERLETEHQPGTGSWDPIFGASASTRVGMVRLAASALYQLSTNGAQHTRLGNWLQGGIALSHSFGEPAAEDLESHNHDHGDELDEHHEHAIRAGTRSSSSLGSGRGDRRLTPRPRKRVAANGLGSLQASTSTPLRAGLLRLASRFPSGRKSARHIPTTTTARAIPRTGILMSAFHPKQTLGPNASLSVSGRSKERHS